MRPLTNRDPSDETDACECRFRGDGDSEDDALLAQEIDPDCLTHGHFLEDSPFNRQSQELAWELATRGGETFLASHQQCFTLESDGAAVRSSRPDSGLQGHLSLAPEIALAGHTHLSPPRSAQKNQARGTGAG